MLLILFTPRNLESAVSFHFRLSSSFLLGFILLLPGYLNWKFGPFVLSSLNF